MDVTSLFLKTMNIKTMIGGMDMFFWIFMIIMDLLIPATMIFYGKRWIKTPPKNINSLSGYRTSMSMLNMDTWIFAHKYCGKLWYKWGVILLPGTIMAMLCVLEKSDDVVGTVGGIVCFIQMIPFIAVIIPTEKALNKMFDKSGNRRIR